MAVLLRFTLGALATAFFAMLLEPFFSALLLSFGIDTAKLVPPLIKLVRSTSAASWFVPVAFLTIGAALGAWLHHLAKRSDARRVPPKQVAHEMSLQMDSMRERMLRAHKRFADHQDNIPLITKLYAEFPAMEVSLNNMGITAPWLHWNVAREDPRPFLRTNAAYLAAVAPLLKAGHVKEAKMLAEKWVGDFKAADQTSLSKPDIAAGTQP